MNKEIVIKKFIAGLLLTFFVVGITPKFFLHNAFAKHVDLSSNKKNSTAPFQISIAGYNCECDNLVAESTFVCDQHIFSFQVITFFSTYVLKEISFSSVIGIYSPLRGPPVNI